jgi:hypothetical protein
MSAPFLFKGVFCGRVPRFSILFAAEDAGAKLHLSAYLYMWQQPTANNTLMAPEKASIAAAVVVDTWEAAAQACARLRVCRIVALDMEGAPLGQVTSLLQLALSCDEIYLFDVLTLGQRLFDAAHLLPILTDPAILKLCYDCRGDCSALFHQHGVRMHGGYDLQVVFTSLFQDHGDPFLKGLHRAVERSMPPDDARAFAERKLAVKRDWSLHGPAATILQRPLSQETIAYAVADVVPLLRMHRLWSPFLAERAVVHATTERMLRCIHTPPPLQVLSEAHPPLLRRRRRHTHHHHPPFATSGHLLHHDDTWLLAATTIMSRIDFPRVRKRQLCFVYNHHHYHHHHHHPHPNGTTATTGTDATEQQQRLLMLAKRQRA